MIDNIFLGIFIFFGLLAIASSIERGFEKLVRPMDNLVIVLERKE